MSSPERKSINISRLTLVLLVGIAALLPLTAFGADEPPELAQPAEQTPPSERIEAIDAPRDYLSEKFVTFVSEIDRFFGDDRNFQESNQSVIQMDITRVTGYSGVHKIVLDGRAKVRLPSVQKRFHLVLETNPDQNLTGESTPTKITPPANKVVTPDSYGAGLRFENAQEGQWHFSTDAGIKFRTFKVDPFTRVRGSYEVPLDQWRLKAAETVFWFQTSGAGTNTRVDVERFLSDPVLFRATSNVTWLKDTTNLDLRQDLSIYHTLSERSALLYQASAIGVSRPAYHATDYVLLMTYRYRLHRKWIFFELSPQMHYPEVMDYHYSPMLSMRLELLLDESK